MDLNTALPPHVARAERMFENVTFGSRWLLAPFYRHHDPGHAECPEHDRPVLGGTSAPIWRRVGRRTATA